MGSWSCWDATAAAHLDSCSATLTCVCLCFCRLLTAFKSYHWPFHCKEVNFFVEFSLNCAQRFSKAIWNSLLTAGWNRSVSLCPWPWNMGWLPDIYETRWRLGWHVILCAAANCFETCIHVVSSLYNDVVIRPHYPVDELKPLVLGHINEVHFFQSSTHTR